MKRFLLVLFMLSCAVANAAPRRRVVRASPGIAGMREDIVTIVNNVLTTYEQADFRVAWKAMDDVPDHAANPLYMCIPVARASAWIVKYENDTRDPRYLENALNELEFMADRHAQWGHSWVTASVVNMFDLAIWRMKQLDDPMVRNRVELLWQRALDITRVEADTRLVWNMPLPPYDSTNRGDTQAEEFAWESSLLTAAAVFLPDHPNAKLWERKARQLAYDAITRPSDPPDLEGIKTTTVTEDFRVDNHNVEGNPYYAIATLQLLQQAELPYRMTGRVAPDELHHNFKSLYAVYTSYVARDASGAYVWNRPGDRGDPSLIPLAKAGDPTMDVALARQKASSSTLWADSVTKGVIPESEMYAAVQNHKVAWYYVVGLYFWHWPAPR